MDYGLDARRAVAAATTDARAFLGAPGLQAGSPADLVTFETDPTLDPSTQSVAA